MTEPSRERLADFEAAGEVRDFLRERGLPLSSEMLGHYLGGSGAKRRIPLERLRRNRAFAEAEERLIDRATREIVRQSVALMSAESGRYEMRGIADDGPHTATGMAYESVDTSDVNLRLDLEYRGGLDFDFDAGLDVDPDLFGVVGTANIKAVPEIEISLENRRFHLLGGMRLVFSDEYDFDSKEPLIHEFEWRDAPSILAGWLSGAHWWFDLETLEGLEQAGQAKRFTIATAWRREVSAGPAYSEFPERALTDLSRRLTEYVVSSFRAGMAGRSAPPSPRLSYAAEPEVFHAIQWSEPEEVREGRAE